MADLPTKGIHVAEPRDRSSIKVAEEPGRHKVPQQVLRGPSIVAKKAGSTITGPRNPSREVVEEVAKLSTMVRELEQQNDRAELEALAAGPSTPQVTGKLPAKANPFKVLTRGLAREGVEGGAKLSASAQVVAQQKDRAELDALAAGPSTPQIKGGKPSRAPTRDGSHQSKDPSWQREE